MVDYRIDLTDQRETMAFVQFALTKKGRFKKSLTFSSSLPVLLPLNILWRMLLLITPSGTPTPAKLPYLHLGEKNKEQILV